MTSYDRHSDGNSPYRTGQHVPLPQSRHAPLTSVATSASESRQDINSPYYEEEASSLNRAATFPSSPRLPSPYSPGMRSSSALRRSATIDQFDNGAQGEIQMQSFQDGLPPAPPVSHSWKRIDHWAEENYAELYDQLCEGCTNNDLNELEHQLDCSLPMEVRESLQIHDGQERGGLPTGIIFGSMLLDCEEMVQEWENWKKVNSEFLAEPINYKPTTPLKTHNGMGASSSAASSSKQPGSGGSLNGMWRQELLAKQDSIPPNAIQKVYAHPAWIPLVRDWGGNNLAVDLAPGPAGRWGQVILFGRDYDRKYVIARSWSAFVAMVADDLSSGKWFVEEESGELKLREFKSNKVEPGYFDILRWRMDEKWKRMSGAAPGSRKSTMGGRGSPGGSPYASPTAESGGESRGRSMQRFGGASPVQSPSRISYSGAGGATANSVKSPLARVAEEYHHPVSVNTAVGLGIESPGLRSAGGAGNLVEVGTPRTSDDEKNGIKGAESMMKEVSLQEDEDKENNNLGVGGGRNSAEKEEKAPSTRDSLLNGDGNARKIPSSGDESEADMKTIDI